MTHLMQTDSEWRPRKVNLSGPSVLGLWSNFRLFYSWGYFAKLHRSPKVHGTLLPHLKPNAAKSVYNHPTLLHEWPKVLQSHAT